MIEWSIPGADGQPIIGDTHLPPGGANAATGTIVVAHGFKGYKDYGMFPRLAREFAAAGGGTGRGAGLVAHRFNFSHSGLTRNIATFERLDLFERDTWSKQVFDLTVVLEAIRSGRLEGGELPTFVLGHSRGGVTAILVAGRLTYPGNRQDQPSPSAGATVRNDSTGPASSHRLAGVITLAAPSSCNPLSLEQQQELLEQGWIESPSSRTGQRLRIGREFLQEQLDDPAGHDVPAHAARIACPMLIIHGADDPTVPAACADTIAAAATRAGNDHASALIIPGTDHVFNTPNPLPDDAPTSPQLHQVIDAVLRFINDTTRGG